MYKNEDIYVVCFLSDLSTIYILQFTYKSLVILKMVNTRQKQNTNLSDE